MFFVQKKYSGYRDGFKKSYEKWRKVLQKSAMANKRGGKGRKGVIRKTPTPEFEVSGARSNFRVVNSRMLFLRASRSEQVIILLSFHRHML